ncbi:MAG: nodulation protein NfeD [Chloroflexi bacterium]|nr:nodulation protein NfeD [Chloroflexota bacterium]
MSRHIVRSLTGIAFVLGVVAILAGQPARAASESVVVLPTTGIVDAVMAGYLEEGVAKAAGEGAAAVVIQLNTPGGSLDSTQKIVSTLLDSPIPTIVWVAPSGARAASAGTFITLAAHVAVMAPGTNIGAASPISSSGEDIGGTLGEKVLNDAIANIRSIAEARGRNVEWAEETVRDARSSPASEAVSIGAVDGLADSIEGVIAFADGRVVSVGGREVTLSLADAAPSELAMNPLQGFLHLLSDPNIAFILFTIGFYGLLYEVISPNFVTGILGAMSIILAFIGFGSLPLNVAGLLLIALAIVLFVLEFNVASHGLLTVAGIAAFALGASALYTEPGTPTAPAIEVDPRIIFVFTALTAAYMAFILLLVARWRRQQELAGPAATALVYAQGALGTVRTALAPIGIVYAAGEDWTARSADGRALSSGTPIRVVEQDGLTLIVESTEAPGRPV